jgi:hypothetical protein
MRMNARRTTKVVVRTTTKEAAQQAPHFAPTLRGGLPGVGFVAAANITDLLHLASRHHPGKQSSRPRATVRGSYATDIDARALFAQRLAREAGALALRYFHRELAYTAESKGVAQDWVSIADRAVEDHCRAQLAAAFPDDTMLGEESGGAIADDGWIIDPIDGTLNFVHGVRYWCVSIVFIAAASADRRFTTRRTTSSFSRGRRGATQNGRRCACPITRLDRADHAGYVQRHDRRALVLRRTSFAKAPKSRTTAPAR